MSDANPQILVSVVNWNTADLTLAALRAILRQDYAPFKVLVVDNGSSDDSVQRFTTTLPDVEVLRSHQNLGFAHGHGLAVRRAEELGAGAIWLVNSDALPAPDALRHLVRAWQTEGDHVFGGIAISGRAGDAVATFPEKFYDPHSVPSALQYDRPRRLHRALSERAPLRVGAVIGSSMLIPCSVISRHGWMSDEWFMHCEEIDYCYRLRRAGVASFLVPASRTRHTGGGSQVGRPRVADVIAYYRARNEILLTRRYGASVSAQLVAVKKSIRAVMTWPVRPARARMIFRGVLDARRGASGKTEDPDRALMDDRLEPVLAHPFPNHWRRVRAIARRVVATATSRFGRARSTVERQTGHSILTAPSAIPNLISEYVAYSIDLFASELERSAHSLRLSFVLGQAPTTRTTTDQRRIGFQVEHTLVRAGGRDAEGALPGEVRVAESGERYLVRLDNATFLRSLDAIVEYSAPNLEHLRRSGRFDEYLALACHIAPILYETSVGKGQRSIALLTTFADVRQPRRREFLRNARAQSLPLRNERHCYEGDRLRDLLDDTRIMINVHQTDHHHTLEELRVLPALLRGVIVVSETVPLAETVPYNRFIVWAAYDELVATARRILLDYDRYHAEIFGGGALFAVIEAMRQSNRGQVRATIARLAGELSQP